jgi:hypothetical protein
MFIMGGINWMSSGGDKGQAEAARNKVTSALVGLIILFSIFGIINLVSCFFGTTFLQFNIGELRITGGGSPFCPSALEGGGGADDDDGGGGGGGGGGGDDGGGDSDGDIVWPGGEEGGTYPIGDVNPNCPCRTEGMYARTNEVRVGPAVESVTTCYRCDPTRWSTPLPSCTGVISGPCYPYP